MHPHPPILPFAAAAEPAADKICPRPARPSLLSRQVAPLCRAIAAAAALLNPLASRGQSNGDILLWNANQGTWTSGNRWYDQTEAQRTGVNTEVDRNLTYNFQFIGQGTNSKAAPTTMSIGGFTVYASSITFQNGFNTTNTTTLANSSTTDPAVIVLGTSAGAAGGTPTPWTITNNATSGMVTLAPRGAGALFDLSLSLYSSGTISVASGAGVTVSAAINDFDATHTGGITKTGAGQLILSGANTYTGPTNVTAGTLVLGASERISNSSGLNLSGGTFNTGGFNETVGALTLSGNATIDMGTSAGSILTFLGSSTYSGGSLTVLNWSGSPGSIANQDKILFSSTTGLSQSFLNSVVFQGFYGDQPGAILLDNGNGQFQLTPIPEPATVIGGLMLLGLVAYKERKRLTRLIGSAAALL